MAIKNRYIFISLIIIIAFLSTACSAEWRPLGNEDKAKVLEGVKDYLACDGKFRQNHKTMSYYLNYHTDQLNIPEITSALLELATDTEYEYKRKAIKEIIEIVSSEYSLDEGRKQHIFNHFYNDPRFVETMLDYAETGNEELSFVVELFQNTRIPYDQRIGNFMLQHLNYSGVSEYLERIKDENLMTRLMELYKLSNYDSRIMEIINSYGIRDDIIQFWNENAYYNGLTSLLRNVDVGIYRNSKQAQPGVDPDTIAIIEITDNYEADPTWAISELSFKVIPKERQITAKTLYSAGTVIYLHYLRELDKWYNFNIPGYVTNLSIEKVDLQSGTVLERTMLQGPALKDTHWLSSSYIPDYIFGASPDKNEILNIINSMLNVEQEYDESKDMQTPHQVFEENEDSQIPRYNDDLDVDIETFIIYSIRLQNGTEKLVFTHNDKDLGMIDLFSGKYLCKAGLFDINEAFLNEISQGQVVESIWECHAGLVESLDSSQYLIKPLEQAMELGTVRGFRLAYEQLPKENWYIPAKQ